MTRMRRFSTLGLSLVLAAGLAGCGGDDGPTTPSTSTLTSGSFSGLQAGTFRAFDFSASGSGTVLANAIWTSSANDVDLFVVGGTTCSTVASNGRPSGSGCTILCEDVRVGGTTASCSLSATSGSARLFIVNLGPGTESGTYQVTLTR